MTITALKGVPDSFMGDFEALCNMRIQLERLYQSTSTVVVGGLS
jgi:uncharacterized protein YllA (UPF0747 family)